MSSVRLLTLSSKSLSLPFKLSHSCMIGVQVRTVSSSENRCLANSILLLGDFIRTEASSGIFSLFFFFSCAASQEAYHETAYKQTYMVFPRQRDYPTSKSEQAAGAQNSWLDLLYSTVA